MQPSHPVNTFLHTETAGVVEMSNAQLERSIKISKLVDKMNALNHIVQADLQLHRERVCQQQATTKLAKFSKGDYALDAKENLFAAKNFCLG